MSAEQQEFLQWVSEQCKSLGASPKMHDEIQILASRVDLTSPDDFQIAIPPDNQCNLLERAQE